MLPEKLVLIDAKEEEVKTKTNQQEVLIPGSVLQSASVDKSIASHMKESDVIDGFKITIQGRKGGLWLHDTSYDNFCNIAMRLVARDMDEIGIAIVEDFYVIIEHQKNIVPADTFRVNVMTGKRQYDTEILHAMRRPEVRIWVSKQILSRSDDLTTEITSKNLKVVAPDIGYYYAFVGAKFKDFNTKQISDRFVRSALRCLFSLGETEVSRIGIFMMPGIGLGGHVIDLSYDVAIDEKIQKTFGRIMSSEEPGVEHYENHPTEVIIYKEPFYRIGPPDGTSYFDYSPPINFATFLNTTKFALYPNVRNSQKWQFFIVPNTEAWEKGIIIGPIDEFGCMRNLNMTTTVLEDLDECREIPWSKGKLIDAKKWNEWKRMNFFPDEAVRLIRCFVGHTISRN